jgi:exosortase
MTTATAKPTPTPPAAPAATAPAPKAGRRLSRFAVPAVAVTAVVWACWPTLATFVNIWSTNPQYSHGFLVIPFAAFLLWHRGTLFTPDRRDRAWVGVVLLLVGCVLKLVGGHFAFAWPDRISVIFLIAGVFGTLGGWPALKWAWPALAFLVFMVPMPGRLETLLSTPLQKFATVVSTNILQTLGFFAQADGTVIILSEADLGIVEACSGLRMLLAFVAMCVGFAIVSTRPMWQRWAVIAGSIPIALACNVGRIVVTAVVLETAGRKWADLVFHDLAGWLMMPAGLALMWLELMFLRRLIVTDEVLPKNSSVTGNSPSPSRVKA